LNDNDFVTSCLQIVVGHYGSQRT